MGKTKIPKAAQRVLNRLEQEIVDSVKGAIDSIRMFGNDGPKTALDDAQDIVDIHFLVEQGKYKKALEKMCNLDTFVREVMPIEDTEFLIDLEEDKKKK